MNGRSLHPRSLVAFLTAGAFLVAAVTGVVLYAAPRGGIASWTGWTLAGLARNVWFDVHLVTGILFVAAALLHLYFNRKPLKAYLCSRAAQGLKRGRELGIAATLLAFVVVGAAYGWPPFGYILDLNDRARNAGAVTAGQTPTASAGRRAIGPGPSRGGGGAGLGRMTLAGLAARYGVDYHHMSARLAAAGIAFAENEPLRDVAARAGMTPGQLGDLVRGDQR